MQLRAWPGRHPPDGMKSRAASAPCDFIPSGRCPPVVAIAGCRCEPQRRIRSPAVAPATVDRGRRALGSRGLRRDRAHAHADARCRDESPVAGRELLAPLHGRRRIARVAGGTTGRRAAVQGLASVAVTSTVVNAVVKPLARRRRPDRLAGDVPVARHVRMPTSRLVPVGAFRRRVRVRDRRRSRVDRRAAAPLRALAAVVAYSRVHTRRALPGRCAGRRPDRHHAGPITTHLRLH